MTSKHDPAKDQRAAGSNKALAALNTFGMVQALLFISLFSAVWLGFCCWMFWTQYKVDRRMAIVNRGEVPPETLFVVEADRDEKGSPEGWVKLAKDGKTVATRRVTNIGGFHPGTEVTAYRFGDEYLIPALDVNEHRLLMWLFPSFLLLPLLVLLVRWQRKRRERRLRAEAPPRPPVPEAFSLVSEHFDGPVDDAQLVCLFDDKNCGPGQAVEADGVLTVRPTPVPLKLLVPFLTLIAVAMTCMLLFLPGRKDATVYGFLAVIWVVAYPGMLLLMFFINSAIAKKGDYFKIHGGRGALELCRLGRSFQRSEIVAITLLSRYGRRQLGEHAGLWQRVFQTGVLVRTADGGTQVYPLVVEWAENVPASQRSKWADRVAAALGVPVRRVELGKSESIALNDC